MQETLAQWNFTPDLVTARSLRQELSKVLVDNKVQCSEDFLLACAELVVNLHRYPKPKPENAELRFTKQDYHWQMELLDDGPSFNNFSQQLACKEPLIAAEGGMGLKLLAANFDEFFYIPACYRQDAKNVMLLRKCIDATEQAPKKLLLVDDDRAFRKVIAAYMHAQYVVIEAQSVAQAFELVLVHKPDLIICDLSIPGADGPALYEMMRPIPEIATTAFIYLSGCTDQALIDRALSRPIDDFLVKPVSKAQLLATVSRTLMRRAYLADRLQLELEQKITLGLHPILPKTIGQYQCALRASVPESGGGDLVLVKNSQLIFADLMGHGIGAKGFVYALAGYIRGLCVAGLETDLSCAQLLKMISRGFSQDQVLAETLATVMTVSLGDDANVTIANAGHPQPILCRSGNKPEDKKVEQIYIDGPLLGLELGGYSELQMKLSTGDRLILYSDGYLDASQTLTTGFQEEIIISSDMPLEQAADYLMQCCPNQRKEVNKSASEDDVTLIVLQWGAIN
jgi:CheY-like chemotaxis protein/anti-sigma regulatory factor (Ser/Thr protein kinase)